MKPALAHLPSVDASAWQHLTFISDLHLQASQQATFELWRQAMQSLQTEALFILGDLFEVWVGDDILEAPEGVFERQCCEVLHQMADRCPVYWMVGNRDFLWGDKAAHRSGMQTLQDPCVVETMQGRWLLSHGDTLCIADTAYQAFRQQVRASQWQSDFLSKPLVQRLQIARELRTQSEALKQTQTAWIDVDNAAALASLQQYGANVLIHGHTHQPALHTLSADHQRFVLSDWDASATPARAQWLTWHMGQGFSRQDVIAA
jgi:UDP-2,3-diacylglucosamine hydrolase